MNKIPADQIQCPKCGQYRMSKIENFGWVHIILSILTFGLYAVIYAVWSLKVVGQKVKTGDRLKCLNCNSRWVYEA